MLGAAHVLAIDVDDDALAVARENADEYEGPLPVRSERSCAQCACSLRLYSSHIFPLSLRRLTLCAATCGMCTGCCGGGQILSS